MKSLNSIVYGYWLGMVFGGIITVSIQPLFFETRSSYDFGLFLTHTVKISIFVLLFMWLYPPVFKRGLPDTLLRITIVGSGIGVFLGSLNYLYELFLANSLLDKSGLGFLYVFSVTLLISWLIWANIKVIEIYEQLKGVDKSIGK
ncbi:hypothetical protein [Emcibacter nanhaiensis]|uniref:Uncharacterized protein n=1 Tax=Emcibacter nanhaiensis TaxID=1505037 RepID=A0A501PHC8_9PROT|nr:hypothetical protein [Emcibacter nanhaiensis]TPD59478.1 hypothetical protein FIV46_11860 [Emcibacter nanhaiensis]